MALIEFGEVFGHALSVVREEAERAADDDASFFFNSFWYLQNYRSALRWHSRFFHADTPFLFS